MTYLLYFRSKIEKPNDNEYIVLTQDKEELSQVFKGTHSKFCRSGFELVETVEIDEDLYRLPLDRELSPR